MTLKRSQQMYGHILMRHSIRLMEFFPACIIFMHNFFF